MMAVHAAGPGLRRTAVPWLGSLALHGAIALALTASLFMRPPPPIQTLGIEAVVVDDQLLAIRQQQRKATARQQQERRRQEQAAADARELQRRAAEVRAARETAAKQAKQQAEAAAASRERPKPAKAPAPVQAQSKEREAAAAKARQATQQRAAEEAARRQAATDARLAQQRERDLRASLAAEETQRAGDAARATLRQQYAALIRDRIERNWRRPPGVQPGLKCTLYVGQIPGGEVTSVRVGTCTADAAVRQSIVDAVYRASPLPAPPEQALFERDLVLEFVPQE